MNERPGEVPDVEEESQNVKLAKLHSLAKQLGISIESIKLQSVDNNAKPSTPSRHLTKSEKIIKIQSLFRMALAKKNVSFYNAGNSFVLLRLGSKQHIVCIFLRKC